MRARLQIRLGALFYAGVFAGLVPCFLLGPALFGELPAGALPVWARWAGGISFLSGALIAAAALLADDDDVGRIGRVGWAGESALLIAPLLAVAALARRLH